MAPTLRLRQDRLSRLCAAAGLRNQTELAQAMGMSKANVSRVLHGNHGPGPVFIASLWTTFPDVPLEELFELERHE